MTQSRIYGSGFKNLSVVQGVECAECVECACAHDSKVSHLSELLQLTNFAVQHGNSVIAHGQLRQCTEPTHDSRDRGESVRVEIQGEKRSEVDECDW